MMGTSFVQEQSGHCDKDGGHTWAQQWTSTYQILPITATTNVQPANNRESPSMLYGTISQGDQPNTRWQGGNTGLFPTLKELVVCSHNNRHIFLIWVSLSLPSESQPATVSYNTASEQRTRFTV